MKKTIIWILMILTIQSVYALSCPDEIEITSNCTIITPSLNCTGTYTYDIINTSDNTLVTTNGNLSQLYEGVYEFNFTYGEGEYLIKLCDESTRQVKVTVNREVKARMYIAIVIIIGVLIVSFMFLAIKAKDFSREKLLNNSLMMLFFFMALGLSIVGLQIAKEMAVSGALSSDISTLITASYKIALWTLYVMVFIVFIIGIYSLFMYAKNTSGLIRKKPNLYDRGTTSMNDRGTR